MNKQYRHVLSVILLLSIWQLVSMGVGKSLLLPAPILTFRALFDILGNPSSWNVLFHTLFRVFQAFLIALGSGLLVGFLMYFYSFTKVFFSPVLRIVQTTPVMSFIMLALLWLPANNVPIFVGFLMGLPIIASSTFKGLTSIKKELLFMTDFFEVRMVRRVTKLYLPAIFPFLELAMKNALSLTWKVCVASEVLSYPKFAMGAELLKAKTLLETERLFAWTFMLILCGLLTEYLLMKLLHVYRYKEPKRVDSGRKGNL